MHSYSGLVFKNIRITILLRFVTEIRSIRGFLFEYCFNDHDERRFISIYGVGPGWSGRIDLELRINRTAKTG